MHAFPSTGGNVAVSHGRNGAGSIANASGGGQEAAGAGSGASQPRPQGTPGSDSRLNYLQALTKGKVASDQGRKAQGAPPLSAAKEGRGERDAPSLFIGDERKAVASELSLIHI